MVKRLTIVTSYGKHNFFFVNLETAAILEQSSSIQKKGL